MSDHTQTFLPALNPGTAHAAADLRTHQFKFVQINGLGVSLADVRSLTAAYVLGTKPNSGEPCQLLQPPNVVRCIAGAAITRGHYIEPMSASGLATGVASRSGVSAGIALSSAAGSGEFFSVHLRF